MGSCRPRLLSGRQEVVPQNMRKERSKKALRATRPEDDRGPKRLTAHFTLAELTLLQTASRMHVDSTPHPLQITGL